MRDPNIITSQETRDNVAALSKTATIRQMAAEVPGWVWEDGEHESWNFIRRAGEAYEDFKADDEPVALTIGAAASALHLAAIEMGYATDNEGV